MVDEARILAACLPLIQRWWSSAGRLNPLVWVFNPLICSVATLFGLYLQALSMCCECLYRSMLYNIIRNFHFGLMSSQLRRCHSFQFTFVHSIDLNWFHLFQLSTSSLGSSFERRRSIDFDFSLSIFRSWVWVCRPSFRSSRLIFSELLLLPFSRLWAWSRMPTLLALQRAG